MIDVSRLLSESPLQNVEWLEQIDSTNNRALALSGDSQLATPCLVGAERQTAGRGRGANQWWGAAGSLMFSVVVQMSDYQMSSTDWPRFSLVTGLAIAETLLNFLPHANVGLKWPNDVWLNGRKVSGILIEQSELQPNRLIVGIGLNVNNTFQHAPDELKQIATSMVDHTGSGEFSRTEVLISFLNQWTLLTQDLADGVINLVDRWSRLCILTGHPVRIVSGNQQAVGVCAGIDSDGALLLRTPFAVEKHYSGTVRLLGHLV